MALTDKDQKFWGPIPEVMNYLSSIIPQDANVLDVGPGHSPFPRATHSVDFVEVAGLPNFKKCDLATEAFPYEDKEFDFVYCRQTIEDSWNPFHLLNEISRVGKAGYIECPSPIAELGRGVDGSSPPYRGYYHHRWFVYTYGQELRLVQKYPFCEYLRFDEVQLDNLLKTERYWGTFYLWTDRINYNHIQHPLNFVIPRDYGTVLQQAIEHSRENTDIFFSNMSK